MKLKFRPLYQDRGTYVEVIRDYYIDGQDDGYEVKFLDGGHKGEIGHLYKWRFQPTNADLMKRYIDGDR